MKAAPSIEAALGRLDFPWVERLTRDRAGLLFTLD